MAADNQLNKALVSKLKCAACPRTVFPPVTGCLRDHVVCSYCLPSIKNCPQPCNEVLIERPLLSSLASCLQYQCFYSCGNYFSSGDIARHEASCIYCPSECPVLDCEVLINVKDMVAHFQNRHKQKLVIKSAKDSRNAVPFTDKPYDVMLFVYDVDTMFWIYTYFENGFTEIVVKLVTKSNKDNFIIEYKTDHTDVRAFGRIFKHNEVWTNYQHDRNYFAKIPLECLHAAIYILFDSDQFTQQLENSILKKIVTHLECPVCLRTMKAPIYLCLNGHSICSLCKPTVTACPTCRSGFNINYGIIYNMNNTTPQRNYSLEVISDEMEKFSEEDQRKGSLFFRASLIEHVLRKRNGTRRKSTRINL